jgi:hypothetical protein
VVELLSLIMVLRDDLAQQFQKPLPMCLNGQWRFSRLNGSSSRINKIK